MPPIRRHPRNPYARQVLGVRLRQAERGPAPLNMTIARRRLMEGIARGEVRPGTGRYAGGYRWHRGNGDSETVSRRVLDLMAAQWAADGETHVQLTEAGTAALDTAGGAA